MAKATAPILPSPDFTFVPGLTPLIAGLRPYREETYRLEEQIIRAQARGAQLWPRRSRHHDELGLRA